MILLLWIGVVDVVFATRLRYMHPPASGVMPFADAFEEDTRNDEAYTVDVDDGDVNPRVIGFLYEFPLVDLVFTEWSRSALVRAKKRSMSARSVAIFFSGYERARQSEKVRVGGAVKSANARGSRNPFS